MGSLSFFNLQDIINKYNTTTLIETGAGQGGGIIHASKFNFEKIYSIEIIQEQVIKLKSQLSNIKNLEIIWGHTTDILQQILPTINGNICFWLDAHYPGADIPSPFSGKYDYEKNEDIRLPLEHELLLIKKLRPQSKDVILIDDLRVYRNNGSEMRQQNAKPRIGFSSPEFYKEVFNETHQCTVFESGEIYGMLTPK